MTDERRDACGYRAVSPPGATEDRHRRERRGTHADAPMR
jgi:hypothetical protein